MIALGLDGTEDLAQAFYLALTSVHEFDRLGTRRWRDLNDKERRLWVRAAERVMQLYPAVGRSKDDD